MFHNRQIIALLFYFKDRTLKSRIFNKKDVRNNPIILVIATLYVLFVIGLNFPTTLLLLLGLETAEILHSFIQWYKKELLMQTGLERPKAEGIL